MMEIFLRVIATLIGLIICVLSPFVFTYALGVLGHIYHVSCVLGGFFCISGGIGMIAAAWCDF